MSGELHVFSFTIGNPTQITLLLSACIDQVLCYSLATPACVEHIYPDLLVKELPPHTMEATFDKSGEVKSNFSSENPFHHRIWIAQSVDVVLCVWHRQGQTQRD